MWTVFLHPTAVLFHYSSRRAPLKPPSHFLLSLTDLDCIQTLHSFTPAVVNAHLARRPPLPSQVQLFYPAFGRFLDLDYTRNNATAWPDVFSQTTYMISSMKIGTAQTASLYSWCRHTNDCERGENKSRQHRRTRTSKWRKTWCAFCRRPGYAVRFVVLVEGNGNFGKFKVFPLFCR